MIINTGCRTDIPGFYSDWFYTRVKEGYVLVRNPYYPSQVSKYRLTPDVVDLICFCTKNPKPMLSRLNEISAFRQFWFVTITPYGKEIEPHVPDKNEVIQSLIQLSKAVGKQCVGWRYDPIFITEKYSLDYHIAHFEEMAKTLNGYVYQCVISFIDLYQKTKRNFPQAMEVTKRNRDILGNAFAEIGKANGIKIRSCCEGTDLMKYGIDISGCMTKEVLERAIGCKLEIPHAKKPARAECNCLLGNDIGMYNSCGHGCVYCYANYDQKTVLNNMRQHKKDSPFLIGGFQVDDNIKDAKQVSYCSGQLKLNL